MRRLRGGGFAQRRAKDVPAIPGTPVRRTSSRLLESEWEPNARRIYNQLRRVERLRGGARAADEPLLKSVLAAFPDRVARRRQGDELLLASGGSAVLAASSVVRAEDWLVAVDVEERRERGLPLVRLASAIRPEWLLDLFPERVREKSAVEWNRKAERVEASSALLFEGLTIEESRGAAPDPEAARSLLAEKALEAGITRFADPEEFPGARFFRRRAQRASTAR